MTWYSQSMLTIGHHLPGAGSFVNGNKAAIGNIAVNTSLVPSSLEDLGLVMEETEDPAVGWGRSLVNGGGQQVPRGDLLTLPPKAVNRTGHNPTSYGFQERATTVGFNGGPVVNPGGLAMGTVQSSPGSIHQPIVVNGPRVNINQSVVYQCDPGMAMPNHVPLPQAGRVVARRPVILDRVGRKEQLVEFDPNGMLGYILVPNGELHAEEQSAMGKVVRLERTMSYGDPKQVRYVMNEIVLGPTTSEPSVNHNGAGDHSVYSSVNGTYPGHHPLGDIAHVTEQVGAPRSYGYVPPWHQGVHTQNVSYRHNWSGGGMANHHGVPGTVPQFDQPMQSTGSNNGAAGLSLLQSALMGAPTAEVDEGAFAHYLSKKQEQGRAENASAKKAGSAPRSRGKKGVLGHSQQTLAVAPPGVATPPKRPRQRKKKGEGGQVVGGSVLPSPLSTARPKGQAKRTYSRKKGGGDLVVQGEAEEIVVEVDLPMMLSDDDDDEENEGRGVEEEEVGYWGEKESGADPLAPNLEDSRAVDAMRTQNVRGNGFHCTLMNWKRKLVMLPKQVTVLGDKKSGGRAAAGRKKSKGRLPPVLKECYVRLERCDAPRPAAKNSRKEEPSSSKAKEEKSTQNKGSDLTSVPSAEESSSPPDSPCKTPNSQRQETDYWLKMLDRERREAFEALKAVRKRLDEEKASCSVALMSVRSSVIEKEFSSEGSGLEGSSLSSSLDDIQWALLEEEFKKREELKRKSASDSSSPSVVEEAAPATPTQDARPTETRVADAKSAEGVARQRRGRPNGSRKMIGWRKDDSSVSSSQEGSNILEDNRALSKFLGGGESSSSVVAVPNGRVAMPEGGICDPRIAELQRKYRSERVRGAGRVPRTRECRVRLERLESGANVPGRSRGVVGGTANASSGMVVDSVEMTLSVTANPVERGDSVSRTSFVCLQGRVGLKRKSQSDLMAVGGRALSRDERQVSSSNSPGRRVLMVQLNKLVVVTKEFNKSPPDTPALESTRLPALEGPKTVKSEAEHHTGYRRRSRTEVAADSERGSPRLKKCFVLLERCDKMNGDSGSGPPPKKRRMRII